MKDAIAGLFEQALDQLITQGIIDAADRRPVQIENTRDPAHGDLATNVAMMHAKAANLAPRALADLLLEHLPRSDSVQTTEIAGPGFINVRLAKGTAFEPVTRCLEEHNQFDFTKQPTSACKLNLSQPTQPGHCMWAWPWCCLWSNTGELAKGPRGIRLRRILCQ